MSHMPLSAQQLYDAAPLGALVRFSDGTVEPPQRHRRKHAAWRSSNGTGRLVRKAPQKNGLPASFTLHVGDFGAADVTVVKAYRVFAVTSTLSFAILDKPRPGQVAVLHDDLGMPTFIHLADTEAHAQAWLTAHPRDNVRLVPAEALDPAHVHLPSGPRPRLAHRQPRRSRRRRHVACGLLLVQLRARRHSRTGGGLRHAELPQATRRAGHPLSAARAAHRRRCPRPPLGLQSGAHGCGRLTSPAGPCVGRMHGMK